MRRRSSPRPRLLAPALAVALCALAATPRPAQAQAQAQEQGILGNVTAGDTGRPLEGAMVLLLDAAGKRVNGVLSATNGWFRITVPAPGQYKLRVERIGYASTDSDVFDVPAGKTVEKRVTTSVKPVQLASIDVSAGSRRCQVRPAEGVATATVWDEARKALSAATWTSDRVMYQFAWMRFQRSLDGTGRRILSENRTFQRHFTSEPFAAAEPEKLASGGFVQTQSNGGFQYFAPDAKVLLSDAFLNTHCFRIERQEKDGVRMIGLAFEPIAGRQLPDVAGTLWLEQATAHLRSLEYRYVNLLRELRDHDAGGELNFIELPNGTWIVKDWRIRMPHIAEERDPQGRTRRYVVTAYQDEGGVVQQAETATGTKILDELQGGLHGSVTDSLGRPTPGARVWLDGTTFATVADDDGVFSFSNVGKGLYRVMASTPALEEAGNPGAHSDVQVAQAGIVEVKLEIPSLSRVILERCVQTPIGSDEAALAGRVLDRSGGPVSGAEVQVTWGLVLGISGGVRTAQEGLALQTDDAGVFTFCGVPTDHTMELKAVLGERESEVVQVPIGRDTETAVVRIVLP